ncbi:MAG TPA: CaiB/BaiF CoA-transferase family protein [Rhodoblastus sp.]|nr:CaiB/BaiF CoA-transferase family protein [Rhodoblastus sp.]
MPALGDLKILEFGGIGPGPFCGMLLADMGAEVLRLDRFEAAGFGVDIPPQFDLMNRNKHSLAIDLKKAEGRELALDLIAGADALIEGFRPGAMERLGLGPEQCQARNARLVYARLTGWGQDGPLAKVAGHDLNYIALTGALHAIGPDDRVPPPPLSLLGDYAGGGLNAAFGIMCALHEARRSGMGQVVDVAMMDGVATLMTSFIGWRQLGFWTAERGANISDGGAHFYGCYETSDGRYVAVAAVEDKFYRRLLELIGLGEADLPDQHDRSHWPAMRSRLEAVFRTRTLDEWRALLEGSEACFAPVLDMDEARAHPHNSARCVFVTSAGVWQPAPSPRLSRTPGEVRKAPGEDLQSPEIIFARWGVREETVAIAGRAGVFAPGTI